MALQGLRNQQTVPTMHITDQIGASVEALEMLGLVGDRDQLTEAIVSDFADLEQNSSQAGEPFIQLPKSLVTLSGLVEVLDNGTFPARDYAKTYVYDRLWTPDTDSNGYSEEEIGNLGNGDTGQWAPHARLAVHNPASQNEALLHFLGQPFDEKYAEAGQTTQLESLAKAQQDYEASQEDFALTALNANGVTMIALTRRIKGEAMPIQWGFMRDATLPRKTVDGVSVVGHVDSDGSRLRLDGSYGRAGSDGGVGLSVGPKKL